MFNSYSLIVTCKTNVLVFLMRRRRQISQDDPSNACTFYYSHLMEKGISLSGQRPHLFLVVVMVVVVFAVAVALSILEGLIVRAALLLWVFSPMTWLCFTPV